MKAEILKMLRETDVYVSGQELCNHFGVSRTAVWKAINQLKEMGYEIEAVQNKGYHLLSVPDVINDVELESIRKTKWAGCEIHYFDTIDSTNTKAKELAESGHPTGTLVVSEQQTAGRGRRGREFYSPKGSGIYLSVILEPKGTLEGSLLITTAAATAVYKAVKEVCGVKLGIKWVNDLYKDNRKVCGILTEAVTDFESGNIEFAIVGIGLNLYVEQEQFPKELQEIAGGIYEDEQSSRTADRNRLAAQIVNYLLEETRELKLSEEYVEHNIVPGNEITITDNKSSRSARALAICPDGKLLVQETDGTQSKLAFGEISIKIPPIK